MTANLDLDSAITTWLRSAAEPHAPPHVLRSVAAAAQEVRQLPPWRARFAVAPMRRGSSIAVGWPRSRRLAVGSIAVLVLVLGVLAAAGAVLLRDRPSASDLFVYVARASLPADLCSQARDCRNALAGWPGGRFLMGQRLDDSGSLSVLVEAPWPSTIVGYSLSPDGSHVAYARTQRGYPATCGQLVVVEPATGEEDVVAEFGAESPNWSSPGWWSSANELTFVGGGRCSTGGDGVFVYDPEAESVELMFDFADIVPGVPSPSELPYVLTASHGDRETVLLTAGSRGLAIVTLDGARTSVTTPDCDCDPWGGSWSPDGSQLVLETRWELLLGGGDGSHFRPIAGSGTMASWSPDGQWLAFLSSTGEEGLSVGQRELLTWSAQSGDVRPVAGVDLPRPGLGTPPRWSPDGSLIYWSDVDGTWAIRPDGTGLRTIDLPAQIDLQWLRIDDR